MYRHFLLLFLLNQYLLPSDTEKTELYFYVAKKTNVSKKNQSQQEFRFIAHIIKKRSSFWQMIDNQSLWGYSRSFVVTQEEPAPAVVTFTDHFTILGTMSYNKETACGSYAIGRTEQAGRFDKDEISQCLASSYHSCREYLMQHLESPALSDDEAFMQEIMRLQPELKNDFYSAHALHTFSCKAPQP